MLRRKYPNKRSVCTSTKDKQMQNRKQQSVALRLMTPRAGKVGGHYDPKSQTWSHRDPVSFSPVKHNREA
ncbi:MAG: hypothetical protein Q8Q32_00400 [bacterium]|nr:hypothetical protein [bacterium]